MILIEYFNKVKDEIRKQNYKIINITNKVIPSTISLHIESLNYMLYEWNEDHNDPRNDIFDYIIRPNDCDFDFTSIHFEEFFKFLMLSKDKDNEIIDISIQEEQPIPDPDDGLDDFWLK